MGVEAERATSEGSEGVGRGGRILAFDGLRGIGLALVIAHHAGYERVVDGRVALDMFFALSGFLITAIILREHGKTGSIGLGRFYLRRAQRLLPALFLALAGVAAFGAVVQRADVFRDVVGAYPYIVLYVSNWYAIAEGAAALRPFDHLWSLSVEEQFYLVWPLVVLGVATKLRRADLLIPICLVGSVGALVSRYVEAQNFSSFERIFIGTDMVADHLLLGCALAVLVVRGGDATHAALRTWSSRLLPLALAIWAVSAVTDPWLLREIDPTVRFPFQQSLVALASVTVIAHLHFERGSRLSTLLSWRPAVTVGVMSYGLYIWHWPVFVAVRLYVDQGERLTVVLLTVPITLLIGFCSYHLIERPILDGRWPLRRAVPPVEVPGPATT